MICFFGISPDLNLLLLIYPVAMFFYKFYGHDSFICISTGQLLNGT